MAGSSAEIKGSWHLGRSHTQDLGVAVMEASAGSALVAVAVSCGGGQRSCPSSSIPSFRIICPFIRSLPLKL